METIKGHKTYFSSSNGHSLTSQQNSVAFDALKQVLLDLRPNHILEIGTAGGGTIQFIRDYLNEIGLENTKIRSFDIVEKQWYEDMRRTGIEIFIDNIFSHSYRQLQKPELVVPYIEQEGVSLVLCDGGSKINEFILLSKFLKKGDVIMAHDYVDTQENFIKNYKDRIWNWREIGDEHINEISEKNNLLSYMSEILDPAVWVAKKKN